MQPPAPEFETDRIRWLASSVDKTVEVALRLQHAGASALCLHGRHRCQREHEGPANWHVVREVKHALSIPVIANGSIGCKRQSELCLEYTGADAVMSATALLRNPSLFAATTEDLNGAEISPGYCDQLCPPINQTLKDCRSYLSAAAASLAWAKARSLDADTDSSNRPREEVIRDHLLAMLQIHLMGIPEHQELWSLISSK